MAMLFLVTHSHVPVPLLRCSRKVTLWGRVPQALFWSSHVLVTFSLTVVSVRVLVMAVVEPVGVPKPS